MEELCAIAKDYGLTVVEDACQAHGAYLSFRDKRIRAGTTGAAGCFSFYPGKNLGAWGDAGAVVTNDDGLAAQIAVLRDHGRSTHYAHQECGYNSRLDSIQAAVLRAKLKHLDRWNASRRAIAAAYSRLLQSIDLVLPPTPEYADSCYHLFVVRSQQRGALRQALLSEEIGCGVHYPVPLHLQPALADLGYQRGDFPLSESVADTVLSLPMHPHLADAEVIAVSMAIKRISHSLANRDLAGKDGLASSWSQSNEP
jgi:dTDP-4-amino-4,6-dideoxygalactose transaminase